MSERCNDVLYPDGKGRCSLPSGHGGRHMFDANLPDTAALRAEEPPPGDPETAVREARRGLMALRLEVAPEIAADVTRRVEEAFTALRSSAPSAAVPEPSDEAIAAAMAMKDFGGELKPFTVPTMDQTRTLMRNKLRAAYAVDFGAQPASLQEMAEQGKRDDAMLDEVERRWLGAQPASQPPTEEGK